MTIDEILAAKTDDGLLNLISRELELRLEPRKSIEEFVIALRALPPGLRAMAATYDLDVSLALDDLGWHFGNWHNVELARETIRGLRELGADRMAELFSSAFEHAQIFWSEMGSPDWHAWYSDSPLAKVTVSLTNEAYDIWEKRPQGLFSFWLSYARRYPSNLLDS